MQVSNKCSSLKVHPQDSSQEIEKLTNATDRVDFYDIDLLRDREGHDETLLESPKPDPEMHRNVSQVPLSFACALQTSEFPFLTSDWPMVFEI